MIRYLGDAVVDVSQTYVSLKCVKAACCWCAELVLLSPRLQHFEAGLEVEAWCKINTSLRALNDACLSALPWPLQIQGKAAPLMVADIDVSKTLLAEGLFVLQVSNGQTGNVLWPS